LGFGRDGSLRGLGTLAAGALLASALFVSRLEAEVKPAQVSALEGKADKSHGENGKASPLAVGISVAEGDFISTAEESRLELKFADQSVLRIGPKAKVALTAAHFGQGPSKRKMTARLFFGNLWAKVTSAISGDQKFQIETENAVAGVRGTTFRVDMRADKSVLVRVYAGAVAVAKNIPGTSTKEGRHEVPGPEEVSRERWEKIVGKQMEIIVAADGTPGAPTAFTAEADKDDQWAEWNLARDAAAAR